MIKKIRGIIEYLAVLFVILDCYSVISIIGSNGNYVKIIAILLMILAMLLGINKHVSFPQKLFMFAVVYLTLQFVFSIFNQGISTMQYWFNQILIFLVLYVYLWKESRKSTFLEMFRNIMFLICVASLVFYVFGTVLNIIPHSSYIYANWGSISSYKNYYYLYEESQGTWFFGKALIRNIGIFAEGPMFAYCICIALWYEMFESQISKIRLITFILAVCTAFSVTGFIFIGVLLLFKCLQIRSKNFLKMTTKQIALLLMLFLGLLASVYLFLDKLDSVSGVSRTSQYLNALRIWKENLFIGVGYKMSNEGGFASGILLALVECGILGSLVYLIPIIGTIIKSIRRRDYAYVALSIGYAEILMLTAVPYKIVTLCVASLLWIYLLEGRKDNVEIPSMLRNVRL